MTGERQTVTEAARIAAPLAQPDRVDQEIFETLGHVDALLTEIRRLAEQRLRDGNPPAR